MKLKPLVVALAYALAANSHHVWAADEAAQASTGNAEAPVQQMETLEIKGVASKPAVPANLPNTTEELTAKKIDEVANAVTTEEALQYLPSVHVRERYIGDINGILVMRVNSSIASAQTSVYADGLLLSNYLNNSYSTPPRWGMVSPEEIERIDVIYGPYSALYPGNSAGGIVQMTTRMPSKLEFHAKADVFQQRFNLFGTNATYNGTHGAATMGNKIGNWSFWGSFDHLDNTGEPMTFGATSAYKSGSVTPVTGAFSYVNPQNALTLITSAAGIDHSIQDNAKIKVAYDVSPTLRATYILDNWQNNSDKTVASYLTNAAGQTVYGGNVSINGANYNVTAPAASREISDYWQQGLTLKSNTGGKWDWEVTASIFTENHDATRASSGNTGTIPSSAATAGTIVLTDGTGWQTLDLRGDFRPDGDLKSKHQLGFGYHADRYVLKSYTYTLGTGNWQTSAQGPLSSDSLGNTGTQALYLQDAVQLASAWKLVAGGRMEDWQASNGSNLASGTNVTYADRSVSAFSPKLSLSYEASQDLLLRGSYGRATRFPTVGELFANVGITNLGTGATVTGAALSGLPAPYNKPTNNPNLSPETVNSIELTAEKYLEYGLWRNSLFGEDKRNALISQTDIASLPGYSISTIENVGAVRTIGLESVLELTNLWKRFDFSGSGTYVNSVITADAQNQGYVDSAQPRIPNWRWTASGTYHASERLSYTLNYRYSGRQHVALINPTTHQYTDPNPGVYGTTVSNYSVFDTKVLYKVAKQWTASFGINNIFSYKYYVNPNPYPQQTIFAGLNFDM